MAKPGTNPKDALAAWQDQNPLRVWRLKQPPEPWKLSVIARLVGKSHTAVGSWERGERLPVLDGFAKIEEISGITARQWMDWFKKKPT